MFRVLLIFVLFIKKISVINVKMDIFSIRESVNKYIRLKIAYNIKIISALNVKINIDYIKLIPFVIIKILSKTV